MSSRFSRSGRKLKPSPAARVQLANDLKDHMRHILSDISNNEMSLDSRTPKAVWIDQMDRATENLKYLFGLVSAALARERNALNPFVALPSDVLVEIFRHADIRGTISATKVCHKWRVSALSHPRLWATIDMADTSFSESNLSLQLSRCGKLPLDLNFHILDEGIFFYNIKIPDNVEFLMSKARSISNISARTFQERIDMVELESLHVAVDTTRPLNRFLGAVPKLRHLSLDNVASGLPSLSESRGNPSSDIHSNAFLKNLCTLHLRGGTSPPQQVVKLLGSLPRLQEVYLSTFKDYATGTFVPAQDIPDPIALISLKLLILGNLPASFLRGFLDSITLPESADMRIDAWPGGYPFHLNNTALKSSAKSVYICPNSPGNMTQEESQTIYYDHATSISQITVERSDIRHFALPSVIPIPPIEALTYISGRPYSVFIWRGLGNLRSFSFTFTPGLNYDVPSTLGSVLSNELIQFCPHLEHVDIVIKKSSANSGGFGSTGIGFKDQAESVIPSFLEEWSAMHGKKFDSMLIEDHINPSRWEICFPIIEPFINQFEIGYISLALPEKFGSTRSSALSPRRFQPDVDPRSTSLPADRTAHPRLGIVSGHL